jgi:transglutaminase-like putative cysteine protease
MPLRGSYSTLPDGDAGTYATLEVMRRMARHSSSLPIVRTLATQAVRSYPGDGGNHHARLLNRWITERTYFLPDPTYSEALHEPAYLLHQILTRGNVGVDCDDVATLTAAMGLSIGLRARFVIAGFTSPNAPFRHVWAELAGARSSVWVPIDPTRPVQILASLPITRLQAVEV